MASYIQFLFLGLGNGAVYAALAMALVVTYRSSGVLNFATGAQALYAAYTYSLLREGKLLQPIPGLSSTISVGGPLGFVPALLITLVIQAILGAICYLAIFRPLRNHRPVIKAVASIGLMGILTAVVNAQAGSQVINVNDIFPSSTIKIAGANIPGDRLEFVATIVFIAVALTAIFRLTRFGLATRATAETEVGSLVSGLSPDRIALANWIISFVICGIAGVLIAPLVPLVPGTYTLFIVPALAAAVVGRFSSLGWAIAAGLGIGALESVAVYVNGQHSAFPSGAGQCIPLVLVLIVLLFRGRPLPGRGTLLQIPLGRAPRPHALLPTALVGTVVGLLAIFLLHGNYRSALILSMITSIVALSQIVISGYAGQISLAQLTLAGVAGFILSTFAHSWGIPFPIAPILAALVATAVGVAIGLPALRIRGLLLAVVTLTFAVGVQAIWFQNNRLDGGSGGLAIPAPRLFGVDLGIGSGAAFPRPAFGVLALVVLVLIALGVALLRRSKLGTAMLAVRADERSAAAAGVNVVRVKLAAFGIAAFIAGIGGSLMAYQLGNVTFISFDAYLGLVFFSVVVLAGISSISGGIAAGLLSAGGILFVAVNSAVNIGNWYGIVAGVGVVFTVIRNPDGLVGLPLAKIERRHLASLTARIEADSTQHSSVRTVPVPDEPSVEGGGPLLTVSGLSVAYGGVVAVTDVSFMVAEGSIVGLIGPNGAGKTTLIDALSGFHPSTGQIIFDGQDLKDVPPARRAGMGMARTFQLAGLSDDLTVEENVVVGLHRSRSRESDQVRDVLAWLDIGTLRGTLVGELSQGQRQLVSVARALVGGPKLLLLDEPAAGLDSSESIWLAERLREVRARGVTILLIDHDMSLVLGLCDTVNVLDYGVLIASGTPDEVRRNDEVALAYLGRQQAEDAT